MPSDTSQRRATKQSQAGAPPPEPEHLPCPRCDSTNTKFCYYNNYNFSQPRHFCKSCRRYWTHGGTLRDIPVGGGSRKNAKRSRICNASVVAASAAAAGTTTGSAHDYRHTSASAPPLLASLAVEPGGSLPFAGDVKAGLNMCGSFTSFLNGQGPAGLFAFGGLGLGVEDMGFGHGRSVWPFPGIGIGLSDGGAAAGDGAGGHVLGSTWQLESGQGGFVG